MFTVCDGNTSVFTHVDHVNGAAQNLHMGYRASHSREHMLFHGFHMPY